MTASTPRHRIPSGRRPTAGAASLVVLFLAGVSVAEDVQFRDDFEGDLSGWDLVGAQAISIRDSGDPAHGRVLELVPDGLVLALVRGSEAWRGVRVAGSLLFPEAEGGYFGVVYNYRADDRRTDFGSVYVKNDGSYIRANPFRDGNASRLLYEEYRVPLTGEDRIVPRRWYAFEAEIVGNTCHLYVGDPSVPDQTFGLFEHDSGRLGFQPRIVGTPVWIDDVRVTSIDRLRYSGPDIPPVSYSPDSLLTTWETLGPLPAPLDELERGAGEWPHPGDTTAGWRPFPTDARGAVLTGRVTEFHGSRGVAYFRTVLRSDAERDAVLHISTVDELALWVGGRFEGFVYRNGYMEEHPDWNAWHDFWRNPEHAGRKVAVHLRPGPNTVLVRVRAGQFASGGFFARLE